MRRLAVLPLLLLLPGCHLVFGYHGGSSSDGRADVPRSDGRLLDGGSVDGVWPPGHPRLYFSAPEAAMLRDRAVNRHSTIWKEVITRASKETCPVTLTGDSVFDAAGYLRDHAFIHVLTGDPGAGQKAADCLKQALSWPEWRAPGDPPVYWKTGVLQSAIAEAYDWAHDRLGPAEAAALRAAIVARALVPAQKFAIEQAAEDAAFHRCSADCPIAWGGVGLLALAIEGEDPRGTAACDLALQRVREWFLQCFGEQGGWGQGVSNLSWGFTTATTGGALWYLEALRRVTGRDVYAAPELPGFRSAYQLPLHFLAADRKSGSSAFGNEDMNGFISSGMMTRFAAMDADARWYLRNVPLDDGDGLQRLIFDDGAPSAERAPQSLSRYFSGIGWIAMRAGWGEAETMVGFKNSLRYWQGDRADQNSFYLDALGERLVVNPGYCQRQYCPKIDEYYEATVGANTLLLRDTKSQLHGQARPTASSVKGSISRFEVGPGYDYLMSEAGKTYEGLKSFTRRMVFVRSPVSYLVILDNVESLAASQLFYYQFQLHAIGRPDAIASCSSIAGCWTLTRNAARLRIQLIEPEAASAVSEAGQPLRLENKEQSTVRFALETKAASSTAQLLVVLYPYLATEAPPQISRAPSTIGVGVEVQRGSEKETIRFNPDGTVTVSH